MVIRAEFLGKEHLEANSSNFKDLIRRMTEQDPIGFYVIRGNCLRMLKKVLPNDG